MSDDGVVRISTQVDVSRLKSGMDQAASAVRTSTQSMASAMAEATAASNRLAEAQSQLGAAAEAGNAQAATILGEYQAQLLSAQSAVEALAASETQETAIVRTSISARMALSSELSVIKGNLMGSTRAAGAFLSTLPGVSAAMQAAFPIFGAAALVMVLGQAVKGAEHLLSSMLELSDETGTGFLDSAIGQLSGLAKAAKQAEDEVTGLATDLDRLISQRQNESLREIARTHGPAAGDLAQAALLTERLQKNQALLQILQAQRNIEAQAAAEEKSTPRQMLETGLTGSYQGAATQSALIAAQSLKETKAQIADLDQTDLNLVQQINDLQAEAADQRDFKTPLQREQEEAARKSLEYQKQLIEMASESARATDAAAKQEEEALDKVNKAMAEAGHSPFLTALAHDIPLAAAEDQKRLAELAETIGKLKTPSLDEDSGKQIEDSLAQAEEAQTKLNEAQLEAFDIQQKNANALAEAALRAQEATHQVTAHAAAEQQAALHAREYAAALAALNEQLKVYQQVGKDAEAAQVQNQISQLQGARGVQATGDQAAIQQQVQQPWLNAFQQINNGWLQVQNRMLFTTWNIGTEFAKMGQNLVIWGLDSAEKWALGWIEKELLTVIVHQSTNATKQASDAAANAATLAQTLAINEAAAQSNAAVAATAALAQTANPAYAAVIFGVAESFAAMASFDTGTGYVPRDGLAMIHQGEAIIPAPTMEDLRGSSGAGDVNIQQQNHFHGFNPDKEFRRQLRRNAADVAGAVQHHLRQTGKA